MIDYINWKRGIGAGAVAGIVWGWLAIAANAVTGAFPFENSILYNLASASIGGAIFGIVVGGFFALTYDVIPFKGVFRKAVFLSTAIWLLLRTTGFFLSTIDPDRFHAVMIQTLQGFVLAILMGCVLGMLWRRGEEREV